MKYMKGYGNQSFRSVKRPKRANRCVLITAVKETRKCSGFAIDSYLKDCAFTAVKRDARVKFLTGYVKGIPSFNRRCTKRMPFLSKLVYKRVQVAGPTSGWSLSYKTFLTIPHLPGKYHWQLQETNPIKALL